MLSHVSRSYFKPLTHVVATVYFCTLTHLVRAFFKKNMQYLEFCCLTVICLIFHDIMAYTQISQKGDLHNELLTYFSLSF